MGPASLVLLVLVLLAASECAYRSRAAEWQVMECVALDRSAAADRALWWACAWSSAAAMLFVAALCLVFYPVLYAAVLKGISP